MEKKHNALDYYFDDLNRCKYITQEQINEKVNEINQLNKLIDAARIEELKREIAEGHLKLVIHCAKEYQNSGAPLADLIQEGNIGLMKAIDTFDPQHGQKFNTYAVWRIKEAILRSIKYDTKLIRTPTYVQEAISRIQKTRHEFEYNYGYEPPMEYLAQQEGMSEQDLEKIMNVSMDPVSIESIVDGGEAKSLKDFIPDPEADLDKDIDYYKLVDLLTRALDLHLTPQEREVIGLRFGLFNETVHTLEECAAKLGKSREHVRQMVETAKDKLEIGAPWLEEFME